MGQLYVEEGYIPEGYAITGVTIGWYNKIVFVPKADLGLVQTTPTEIYNMDLNWFRLQVKALEDGPEGMPYPDVTNHNTEVSLGGLTYARVIEILEPYTITFEDGQYAVNLTGANSNVGDRVNVNNVSIRSANSAGMTSSPAIEYSSFNGAVSVDASGTLTGTTYPMGTPQSPVNSLSDAMDIALYRGFTTLSINGNLLIDSGGDYREMIFIGSSKTKSILTVSDAAQVDNCEFYDAHVTGILDGDSTLKDCLIDDLDYVTGFIEQCVLDAGIILLGQGATAHFLDCWSGVPGTGTPTIDMGGSGQSLAMRNYNGGIKLINKTGTESISLDLNSGQVQIDLTTVIAGTIVIRGIGKVVESTTGEDIPSGTYGDLVVLNEAMNRDNISSAVWDEPIADHLISGSTGLSVGRQQFNGVIYVGLDGDSGTEFPTGTEAHPVNNVVDALAIASANGIHHFNMTTDFTVGAGTFDGYTINGYGRKSPILTVVGTKLNNMYFKDISITGTFDNTSVCEFTNCTLIDIHDVSFTAISCVFGGNITLGTIGDTNIYSSFDLIPGTDRPVFSVGDCLGLGLWNWVGGIMLTDMTNPATVSTLEIWGRLTVDDSNTQGSIIVRGPCSVYGETGGTVIASEGVLNQTAISEVVWNTLTSTNFTIGSIGEMVKKIYALCKNIFSVSA